MKVFDPSAPAMVHDHRNDRIFEWSPSWHGACEKYATEVEPGIISFNGGLLLDGWRAVPVDAGSAHPEASRRSTTSALAKRYIVSLLAQLWRPL
jgi:hypothetical protein